MLAMSTLDKLLIELYPNQISESESKEAGTVLIGFFKELQKINTRLEQEKLIEKEGNNFKEYETQFDDSQNYKS
jgi:hypothetical protein